MTILWTSKGAPWVWRVLVALRHTCCWCFTSDVTDSPCLILSNDVIGIPKNPHDIFQLSILTIVTQLTKMILEDIVQIFWATDDVIWKNKTRWISQTFHQTFGDTFRIGKFPWKISIFCGKPESPFLRRMESGKWRVSTRFGKFTIRKLSSKLPSARQ